MAIIIAMPNRSTQVARIFELRHGHSTPDMEAMQDDGTLVRAGLIKIRRYTAFSASAATSFPKDGLNGANKKVRRSRVGAKNRIEGLELLKPSQKPK